MSGRKFIRMDGKANDQSTWKNRSHTFGGHEYSGFTKVKGQREIIAKSVVCPVCNVNHTDFPTRIGEMAGDYKSFNEFKTRKEREAK